MTSRSRVSKFWRSNVVKCSLVGYLGRTFLRHFTSPRFPLDEFRGSMFLIIHFHRQFYVNVTEPAFTHKNSYSGNSVKRSLIEENNSGSDWINKKSLINAISERHRLWRRRDLVMVITRRRQPPRDRDESIVSSTHRACHH